MNSLLTKFLLILKNATSIKKKIVIIKQNKKFLPFLKIFYTEGLILNYIKKKSFLIIRLNYYNTLNNFKNIKLVSKNSKTIFLKKTDIFKICEKNRLLIFSTSKGFLTSLDCKKLKLGGSFLFIC